MNGTIILAYLMGGLSFLETMYELNLLLVFVIGISLFIILIRFGIITWKTNMITNEYRVEMACITGIGSLQMNYLGESIICEKTGKEKAIHKIKTYNTAYIVQVKSGSNNKNYHSIIVDSYNVYSIIQTNIWDTNNPRHNELFKYPTSGWEDTFKILVQEKMTIKVWIHPDRPHLLLLD